MLTLILPEITLGVGSKCTGLDTEEYACMNGETVKWNNVKITIDTMFLISRGSTRE